MFICYKGNIKTTEKCIYATYMFGKYIPSLDSAPFSVQVFPVEAVWRPLGLQEVEAPTFSDIRLINGGKVAPFLFI
jgi:hypothetical protein